MDRRAWRATVHEVTKSWTRPSDLHFHFFHCISHGFQQCSYVSTNCIQHLQKVKQNVISYIKMVVILICPTLSYFLVYTVNLNNSI